MPGKVRECINCGKVMRSDNLKRHMKKCNDLSTTVTHVTTHAYQNKKVGCSKFYKNLKKDKEIPEFDGAKFCEDKSKSRERLMRMMDMLAKREEIIQNELKINDEMMKTSQLQILEDFDARSSDYDERVIPIKRDLALKRRKFEPIIVRDSRLNQKEKELLNRFSELFHDMKENGEDNGEQLCVLLDEMEKNGVINNVDYQIAFNAIEALEK